MSDLRNAQSLSIGSRNYVSAILLFILNVATRFWYGAGRRIDESDIKIRIAELSAERAAEINARLARGNTSIQEGAIVSAEEIDREFGRAPWRN